MYKFCYIWEYPSQCSNAYLLNFIFNVCIQIFDSMCIVPINMSIFTLPRLFKVAVLRLKHKVIPFTKILRIPLDSSMWPSYKQSELTNLVRLIVWQVSNYFRDRITVIVSAKFRKLFNYVKKNIVCISFKHLYLFPKL